MLRRFLPALLVLGGAFPLAAADWTHWRGPAQTGQSLETGLPDEWDPRVPGKNNLIWKQPFGGRTAPIVMNGRVFITGADKEPLGVPTLEEKKYIGERVTAFDAVTGKVLWAHEFNVFHADIVANRLGWAPLAGDAENNRLYVHNTAGDLNCYDAATGKILWTRQLTEEFGRVTGYGGRLGGGPLFDSGLVIVGLVTSSWGNFGPGANRFLAFDGKTGECVWINETPGQLKVTYQSNPVVAEINGERLVISGGADGNVVAFQVRTGKLAWSYLIAAGAVNASPVVHGNMVYCSHGEENPEGAAAGLGKVVCLDAAQVVNGKPKLVWEFRKGVRFGLSSPAYADGLLYVPDDGAKLFCFDAKTGKQLWKYSYGTNSRGAPVIADGKLYISETNFKFHIIKLKGKEAPDEADTHTVDFRPKPGGTGFVESNSTPSIADGRIYLANRDDIFCIATADAKKYTPKPVVVAPEKVDLTPTQLQIFPFEVTLAPGEKFQFTVNAFNAKGQKLGEVPANVEWSLPVPPLPKGATTPPPALDATIANGALAIAPMKPTQQGYVEVTSGTMKARARVRVAARIPYKQDFEKVPPNAVPGGWVNAQGKFYVAEIMEEGKPSKVLVKVNDNPRPPIARANAYITGPNASNYTIEADVKGTQIDDGKLPDMGIVNGRYSLVLDGKPDEKGNREVRISTWEALPTPLPPGRITGVLALSWKNATWYRCKLCVVPGDKETLVQAKVWERNMPEPEKWMVEMKDPRPNLNGAAALFGYVSNAGDGVKGAEIYYDNVVITPNTKTK